MVYTCSAIYRFPDRIDVWFDRIGVPTKVQSFPPNQLDLPDVGQAYDESELPISEPLTVPET